MGWWSTTIMGGDLPLDYEGMFMMDVLSIDTDDWYGKFEKNFAHPTVVKKIKANLGDMVTKVMEEPEGTEYRAICAQVLGVIIISSGILVNDEVIDALNVARKGAEDDEWQHNNEERAIHIKKFIELIDNYDGKPVEVLEEGLLEAIFKHAAEGKTGLVNK